MTCTSSPSPPTGRCRASPRSSSASSATVPWVWPSCSTCRPIRPSRTWPPTGPPRKRRNRRDAPAGERPRYPGGPAWPRRRPCPVAQRPAPPCFCPFPASPPPGARCSLPGARLCAQPAFFQPSRHLWTKKKHFVKKNANSGPFPSSLPDNSACSPSRTAPETRGKKPENQEITDFFRQSALTSPAKHVSVFSSAAGLQAVLGITCGVSVTFERVFFHVQVHLCWEPPLGRY